MVGAPLYRSTRHKKKTVQLYGMGGGPPFMGLFFAVARGHSHERPPPPPLSLFAVLVKLFVLLLDFAARIRDGVVSYTLRRQTESPIAEIRCYQDGISHTKRESAHRHLFFCRGALLRYVCIRLRLRAPGETSQHT